MRKCLFGSVMTVMSILFRELSTLIIMLTIIFPLVMHGSAMAQETMFPLEAFEFRDVVAVVGPEMDAVADDELLDGTRSWKFSLANHGTTSVDGPSIAVQSGHDPALFPDIDTFPVSVSQINLGFEENLQLSGMEKSKVAVSFTPGFTSSRSMEPLDIPPGGGIQTVTVRVTPRDLRYNYPHAHIGVSLPGNVQSITNPDTSQGETLDIASHDSHSAVWLIHKVRMGKEYVFTAVIFVNNNHTSRSLRNKPSIQVGMTPHDEIIIPRDEYSDQNSITILDDTLDGDSQTSGRIIYSVSQPSNWTFAVQKDYTVEYSGLSARKIPVAIDIKPGSYPNAFNLQSGGNVPVAIFSSSSFDATTVDPATIELAQAPVQFLRTGIPQASYEDVNNDGLLDLVVHIVKKDLHLDEASTEAVLTGFMFNGLRVEGKDSVKIVR